MDGAGDGLDGPPGEHSAAANNGNAVLEEESLFDSWLSEPEAPLLGASILPKQVFFSVNLAVSAPIFLQSPANTAPV